jgi:hypothetical protein
MPRADATNMASETKTGKRPWIGIMFECCAIYSRLYRAPGSKEYRGRCPRCLRAIHLPVGEGGTDLRQFRAK